jgi:hypothetical protein
LPGNIYNHNILEGCGEIVADLTAVVILKLLGLRKTMIISYFVAAVSMAVLAIYMQAATSPSDILISILVMFARFGISAAYLLNYLFNAKIFEQNILATTLGICYGINRVTLSTVSFVTEIDPPRFS